MKGNRNPDEYVKKLVVANLRNTYNLLDPEFVKLMKVFTEKDVEWLRDEFISIGFRVLKRLKK